MENTNIEKELFAYFEKLVEAEKLPPMAKSIDEKKREHAKTIRRPWGRIAKIAVAAMLVIAAVAALTFAIKYADIGAPHNGTDVLIDDTSDKESEVESTETDNESSTNGEEGDTDKNNGGYITPPEGVTVIYAPDTNTVIGGYSGAVWSYSTDCNKLWGIKEAYLEENGLDTMYYVMIAPNSKVHETEQLQYEREHPDEYSKSEHTFEKHIAHLQDRIDTDKALLEQYGITNLELQWICPTEADLNKGNGCFNYAFVGYVAGKTLLGFQKTMDEYFFSYYDNGAEFPSNAIGGEIFLMPKGYNAGNYFFGIVSTKNEEGHWMRYSR